MMSPVLANAGVGSSFFNVDSVMVELHDVMPPFATAYTTSGMLQVYGNLNCPIPFAATGNSYYVVVKHRNSLETWSKFPVSIGLNTSFNFTSQ